MSFRDIPLLRYYKTYKNNGEVKLSLHLSVAFSVTKLFSQKIKIKHLIFSAT